MYVFIYIYIYIYVYIQHINVLVCVRVYNMCVWVCVCVCVCEYVCVCLHIFIYVDIHTHKHTHKQCCRRFDLSEIKWFRTVVYPQRPLPSALFQAGFAALFQAGFAACSVCHSRWKITVLLVITYDISKYIYIESMLASLRVRWSFNSCTL